MDSNNTIKPVTQIRRWISDLGWSLYSHSEEVGRIFDDTAWTPRYRVVTCHEERRADGTTITVKDRWLNIDLRREIPTPSLVECLERCAHEGTPCRA